MRVPRRLYVVFVRLFTGSSIVHAATGDRAMARYYYKQAESRGDCDQIWLEVFRRDFWNARSHRTAQPVTGEKKR